MEKRHPKHARKTVSGAGLSLILAVAPGCKIRDQMRREFNTCLFTALALAVSVPLSAKTVLEGAYTELQAARGQAAYSDHCARCHADNMNGGFNRAPSLITSEFMEHWRDDNLEALFIQISQRMPPGGARNRIPESDSVDILTAILQANDYPAGKEELTLESLKNVQLIGKDGPKPLPTNALVAATGCLSAGPNDSWTLTSASEPVRTKTADGASPEEIAVAAAQRPGTQVFRLTNTDTLDRDPAPDKGHKVLVRGALVRQAAANRISVVSLTSVAPGCTP
jgi:mono/diheme cytochrome c family protein